MNAKRLGFPETTVGPLEVAPVNADGEQLPSRSYEQLRYPDYGIGREEERFARQWEQYIESGGELDPNEVQLAHTVARAFWWLRHLDQVRRQREIGGERAGARQVNEFQRDERWGSD